MGSSALSDVAGGSFWAFVAVAVVLLSVATRTPWHKACLAWLNLAFCLLVVGWQATVALGAVLACLHWACKLGDPQARLLGVVATGLLLGTTFLMHKLPAMPDGASATLKPVLAAIGFSYVFLRTIEYLRAATGGRNPDPHLSDTVNYLIPFHMLAAGPVMAFSDFRRQPVPAAFLSRDEALSAFERIARGLFKKFVLANGLIETVFLTDFKTGGAYFLFEVQMYYLFIYLDFSAYTDIAIGIGRLLGVATPENFNKPLRARNIVVFWERWHISLSQFIRRNLFIPVQLAGMRWTQGRYARLISSIAFSLSFVSVGLWHGLSLRFLLWGAGHALALIVCNLYRDWLTARLGRKGAKAFSERPVVRVAATVLTFEFVAFSLAFLAHPGLAFLR